MLVFVEEREEMLHAPSAQLRRVWDSTGFNIGPVAHWRILPTSYVLKPPNDFSFCAWLNARKTRRRTENAGSGLNMYPMS